MEPRPDALLAALVATSSDAIICCDGEQRIVEFNQGAERMFLWLREEVLGQPLDILIPARFHRAHGGYVGSYAARGEPRRMANDRPAVCGLRRNGEEFDAEATIAKHEIGGRRWFSVIVRDLDTLSRAKVDNERGWRELFEACPEGIFIADLDGRYTDINPAGCQLLGYRRDELVGTYIVDLLTADQVKQLVTAKQQLQNGDALLGEWLMRHKDGSYLPTEVNAKILADGRWIAFVRDISDRKAVEAALHLDQQRLRVALTGSPISAFTQDRDLRVTWSFNPPPPFTPADVIGKTQEALTLPSLAEHLRGIKQGVIETGVPARELICSVIDETERYFDSRFEPLRDEHGRIVGITGAAWEVTDRKRAEDAQRFLADVSAALSAAALDWTQMLAQVAPVVLDRLADCCIAELVDDAGYVEQCYAGDVDPDRAVPCEALHRVEPPRRRPLLGFGGLRSREPLLITAVSPEQLAMLAPTEEALELLRGLGLRSLIAVPLVSSGRFLGTYLLGSRSRRYHPGELTLTLELAHRVAVAVDNARLYRAVQRASNARAEVLAIVAHDLRSPLSSITLQAQLLSSIAGDEPSIHRALRRLHRSADVMDRLIHDLLDVVRLEAGQPLGIEFANLPPMLVAEHAIDALRSQAAAMMIDLELESTAGLPEIRADHDRLVQVLDNLVGNALKFSGRGARVVVGLRRQGDGVVFSVTDSGPGLRPDQIDHLFDRFWQAERRDRRGSGLGLTLVKAIIEAHHGTISVDSRVGSGTTFYVTIPAQ